MKVRGCLPMFLLLAGACGPSSAGGDAGLNDAPGEREISASADAGAIDAGPEAADAPDSPADLPADGAPGEPRNDDAGDMGEDDATGGDASIDTPVADASDGDVAPIADATVSDSAWDADGDATDASTPQPCGSTPAAKNVVLPFFNHIFDGKFALVNHFDHDIPQEFSDTNGYQIDWCGRRRTSEIDGHSGYDFSLPQGTPVLAAADGTVNWAGDDIAFYCPLKGQQVTDQQRVEITHKLPDGRRVTSNYKHFSRIDVDVGQKVRAGDVIGLSGNTGCSTGPHLHFETWLMDGTRSGASVLFDAFGWEGSGTDPWDAMTAGAPSIWLWKPGAAPDIFTTP